MKLKNGHRDLIVWQKAMDLAEVIYVLTKNFPKEETYEITSQMRRAAISIPSNIAEGSGRKTMKDYKQFLAIAYGSALELETQFLLCKRLSYFTDTEGEKAKGLLIEILKMLNKMTIPESGNWQLTSGN